MKKIQLSDVLDLTAYEKKRAEVRPRIMEIKKQRRIHVGPRMTYLFENYDTMWYQVQEMTRAERIVEDTGIMGELNAYNELIPEKNQLSASLLIEIDDISQRKSFLTRIVDLPQHTYIQVGKDRVKPVFDDRQGSEDKLSSVQYIKFNLSPDQVAKFNDSNVVINLGFDHPEYSHEHSLTPEEKRMFYAEMND